MSDASIPGIAHYFTDLARLGSAAIVTRQDGQMAALDELATWTIATGRAAHADGKKLMFIGNGGSASIASHMAVDYSKNGGMRALAFNDGAFLTCIANDFGYDNVFAKQIELHASAGDLLIAISSSGKSANILNAVAAARERSTSVLTMSGFEPTNPLRQLGDYNLYIPSSSYGFVEIGHLAVCHCILDTAMGWGTDPAFDRIGRATHAPGRA